ncbi:hypothetical protein [Aeromonas schubertii]|uniref:Uncharacterized protein n=1 Tax=Aeromonas schubertii TaxID=652 RepID=A0A0S2SJX3_9GAMM|nr:hypothetical protein [Aeromonas schubertii]ALP41997.1 hypothetical protein WL1483_2578 [Aeromonas schubertii]
MRIESAQSMARIDYQHASEQQRVVRPAAQPVPQASPPQSNAKQEESEWESDGLDNRTRLIKLMIEAVMPPIG